MSVVLQKVEHFDEDVMKQILVDPRFSTEDRRRLSDYYRHRTMQGTMAVMYEFGRNTQELRMGRLYPMGGRGLQSFQRDIRTPLLSKGHWDVDMENCHYNIALKYAKNYGIAYKAIERYCTHRDECLAEYGKDRKAAKTAFLKIAYGGDISLYRADYEDMNTDPMPEGLAFLAELKQEMTTLAQMMWMHHPELHKIKSGKENKPIEKRANRHAVLMSLVFQDEERKSILALDHYLTSKNRTMAVIIHDGGAVEKVAGELEFPEDLLRGGEAAIKAATGYQYRLTVKPLTHSYQAPIQSANEYAKMKVDFEKRNFLIGPILNHITEDGVRLEYKIHDAHILFQNLKVSVIHPKTLESYKESFFKLWLEDPERRSYERCDFIPNPSKCPASVYNLFQGFAAEASYAKEVAENGPISKEEMMQLIEPIRKHNAFLCGGDATYYEKWEANIIQTPDVKSDVGLFFRDKGGLLFEGGGTGKNLKMDWFGNMIIGEPYYLVVDDNSLLYGQFNSIFEGKLLIFVEEASGKDNHGNINSLKSKITKKKGPVNKKNIAQYIVYDYGRFLFASNDENPLPSRNGDRRLAIYDTIAIMRGNKDYFVALATAMASRRVQCAYYQYLKTLEIWTRPIDYQLNRPITLAYIDVRQMNAPGIMKWLRYELRHGSLPMEAGTRELYGRFQQWQLRNGREGRMSETMFGKLIKEGYVSQEAGEESRLIVSESARKAEGVIHRFDYKKLIEGMEKLHLLAPGECRINDEGFLIQVEREE